MKLLRMLLLIALTVYLGTLLLPIARGYWGYGRTLRTALDWERISEARLGTSYQLRAAWTTFPITGIGDTLRLVTNVAFRPAAEAKTKDSITPPRWAYSFDCEYLDERGGVIGSRGYDAYAGWPSSKENFFVDGETPVSPGYVFLASLKENPDAQKIRIKLRHSDPEIAGVTVRAYMRQRFTERTLEHRWNRLTPEKRVILTSGNLYPPELLRDVERFNVMTNLWNPMGPEGIPNADYVVRELYSIDTEETPPPDPRFSIPQGMALDVSHYGTFPISKEGGKFLLEFVTPEGKPVLECPDLLARWYGKQLGEKREWTVPAHEIADGHTFEAQGGLMELVSSCPLFMRVYQVDGEQKIEVTPPPLLTRAFLVGNGRPAEFTLFHSSDSPTYIRVDLRRLRPNTEADKGFPAAEARYQVLGPDGALLGKDGLILPDALQSPYDRLSDRTLESVLSDPVSFCFVMPKAAHSIRIFSEQPLLVNASVRPGNLVRELSIPADYWASDPVDERQAAWFPKRAEDYTRWITEEKAPLVLTQYRPPEDNPVLLSGDFEWDTYTPVEPWRGRMLLTPRREGIPFRAEILENSYVQVPSNGNMTIPFDAYAGSSQTSLRVLYARTRNAPLPFTVLLDGRACFEGTLAGSFGEFSLPPVAVPKEHRFCIETGEKASFFVNQVNPERLPNEILSFSRKMAVRLGGEPMHIPFPKKTDGEEVLSLQYFVPEKQAGELVLLVRIDSAEQASIRPVTRITHLTHRFYLTFEESDSLRAIAAGEEPLRCSPLFFVPFGDDLSAGDYEVSIALEKGPEGYLIASSTVPGRTEKREFRREESWVSAEE